jgi:hypothetical protein
VISSSSGLPSVLGDRHRRLDPRRTGQAHDVVAEFLKVGGHTGFDGRHTTQDEDR